MSEPVETAQPLTADEEWAILRNGLSKAHTAKDIDAALATARPRIEAALAAPPQPTVEALAALEREYRWVNPLYRAGWVDALHAVRDRLAHP